MIDILELKNQISNSSFRYLFENFSEESIGILLNKMPLDEKEIWIEYIVSSSEFKELESFLSSCYLITNKILRTIFQEIIIPLINRSGSPHPLELVILQNPEEFDCEFIVYFKTEGIPYNFRPRAFIKAYKEELLLLDPEFLSNLVSYINDFYKEEKCFLISSGVILNVTSHRYFE